MIYMDHHATTPVDPRVVEKMLPYFSEKFGNAHSPHHAFGSEAHEAVEVARAEVAKLIGASAEEIYFTSGATESNNLALKGVCEIFRERGNHIVTCVTEHSSVLDVCKELERSGISVTYLPVGPDGRIDLGELDHAITPQTILVSLMTANNEIGTIQSIRDIGKITRERQVLFHTDATQAAGKIPLDVEKDMIDLLSLSAHKMYGPKGVGALYVRKRSPRVRVAPQMQGGGHEGGLRSGTLNVTGIVGLGEAAKLARELMKEEARRVGALRDRLQKGITSRLDHVRVNGSAEHRLWNNLNLSFAYVEGESLLKSFDTIALSSSSACSSLNLEVSYVLKSLGLPEELVHASLRFGLGRFNTQEEVDQVIEKVVTVVNRLRGLSTLYQISQKGAGEVDLARMPGKSSGAGRG